MTRRQLTVTIVLACAAVAAGIAAAIWSGAMSPRSGGPVAGEQRPAVSGAFELTDAEGRSVPWGMLGDRLQLVFFGFTHCPEACPVTLARLTEVIRGLGDRGAGLRILFITVDPERDTPAAMRAYTAAFGPQVVGLSGSAEQIAAAAAAFGVFYEKVPMGGPGDYMMNHTAAVFLLGPDNEILELIPYGATGVDITAALSRHL